MYTGKSKEHYELIARRLRARFDHRIALPVRDVGEVAGVKGTAAATHVLDNLVKFGFAYVEQGGKGRKFFLDTENL
jgi:hypothetical protein